MMEQIKRIIIIPAYNEEDNIGAVLDEIHTFLTDFDVIVINDGSTDRTGLVAEERGVTVLNLPYNLGIGAAVQTGYRYALENGYDIAIQFDGDGQHRADQIPVLVKPLIQGKADLVVGSRFLSEEGYRTTLPRMVGIGILSSVISLLTGLKVTDPTSGFRAANRAVIEFFSRLYPDDYPEPESIVLLRKGGVRILEVPVSMRERLGGVSSITPLRAIYYMIKVLLAIMIDMLKKV